VANPEILKRGAEDNVSAVLSFIANAHNELHAFILEKHLTEKMRLIGEAPHFPLL